MQVALTVEEEGLEVHLGEEEEDSDEPETGGGKFKWRARWRLHVEKCLDPSKPPKPKFLGDAARATVQCSFRRGSPKYIDEVKEHLREAAEHARMIAE